MGLESGSFLNDLVTTNPAAGDLISQGDDHLRLIKTVLQGTFPALAGRSWRAQDKAADYTVLTTDNMTVITSTATLTLNLTAAATLGNGHMFVVIAGADTTIEPNGAELINGTANQLLPTGFAALVFCTGSAFRAIVAPRVETNQVPVLNVGSLSVSAAATLNVANVGSLSVSAVATIKVANIGSLSVSAAAVFATSIASPIGNLGSLSVSSIVSAEVFRNRNITAHTTATTLTASVGAHMVITAAAGAATVMLPLSPTAGDHVQVHNATSREDHVISRNGEPIMSLAENMTIDKANVTASLVYVDATRGWRLV